MDDLTKDAAAAETTEGPSLASSVDPATSTSKRA